MTSVGMHCSSGSPAPAAATDPTRWVLNTERTAGRVSQGVTGRIARE